MAMAPRSSPTRASCIWPACWTWARGGSSASPSASTTTPLAYAALVMAIAVRGGKQAIDGVILHTDQGSEYTAGVFQAACARLGVRQSMGRVGSALDNAVIESWHSTLEFELRRDSSFATRAQARRAVAEWIDDYNHERRHSALGMRSPIAYEQALTDSRPGQAA